MWQGKNKAITFSFDDGVTQDVRLVEILNKYGLKSTFNLNSSLLGLKGTLPDGDGTVLHNKVEPSAVKDLYRGHEVAVHTLTHPLLTELSEETIIRQVNEDRRALSELCGYEVIGMAYPCGGVNNDERVAEIIKNNTKIKYSRTITSTHSFEPHSENMLRFNPTLYWREYGLDDIIDEFLALKTDRPQLLYIWGHSYELDMKTGKLDWQKFEKICAKISGKSDIYYGTNKEVFFGE